MGKKLSALELIQQGVAGIIPEQELVKKLQKNRPLIVKFGADPTSPDLHLGHAIALIKLRDFQELGHDVVFLIGDFTARIGDPSGRSKTRPPLTPETIAYNMKTYFEQVGKILDKNKIRIMTNSEFLAPLTFADVLILCAKVTVSRIIEREDFASRIEHNMPIGMHELLYPLMQGYDSVALRADIELGGTDQTFNMLVGRVLQEHYGQEPQVVITMPLLEGLDGHQKMSKSLGNTIDLTESADQAYGKLMSISDILMFRYLQLLLRADADEIQRYESAIANGVMHPMDVKKEIAQRIIAKYWSSQEAAHARNSFEALFQKKDYSHAQKITLPAQIQSPIWIVEFIKLLGINQSSSEIKRLIDAGAVSIHDVAITDFKATINLSNQMLVKVGKTKIFRVEWLR